MSLRLKANTIALSLGAITKATPEVIPSGDGYIIRWRDEQIPIVSDYIERQLDRSIKEPGKIQVEYQTAVLPVLYKRYFPALLLSGASILFLGYSLKRRKRR
jgi:hypothetical protein